MLPENLIPSYLNRFPGEGDRVALLADYLAHTAPENVFSRKNFEGHITTSVFIINVSLQELLLLRHKSLNRWLQPGGHVEGDSSLLASALREVEEETGIFKTDLQYIAVDNHDDQVPFDIDSHYIPVNPNKQEEGHYHHDLRYLFSYTGNGETAYSPDESTGLKWVPFAELEDDTTFGAMVKKILSVL